MVELDVYYSAELAEYNFGPAHPMAPIRLTLTFELISALGLWELPGVKLRSTPIATDPELGRVHSAQYLAAVGAASRLADGADDGAGGMAAGGVYGSADGMAAGTASRRAGSSGLPGTCDSEPGRPGRPDFGLVAPDCPPFPQLHRAAARITGATLAACRAVSTGSPSRAVNFAGGMHHAMPAKAAGFCIYNDAAVGIAELLATGVTSVVYLDIDAHHGDGVEYIFRTDPRVTTISLHQHPTTLYPFTGYPQDIGGSGARGHAINLCLPPGSGDSAGLRALEAIVEPVLRELQPEVVITQHGCDGHRDDPLTELTWSIDGMRAAAILLRDLIMAYTPGRWVALGGGGYAVRSVPPRAWTHLVAVAADHEIAPTITLPPAWLKLARRSAPGPGAGRFPTTMGDGVVPEMKLFAAGYDPADPVDRAIIATRSAVFPELGIDSVRG